MRRKDTRGLAAEAAAIIAEGVPDWSEARRKLAEEYEITSSAQLPDDDAIESALREHYAIFDPKGHAERLLELRRAALIVMKEVSDYKPLLIRGVLNGCADKYSPSSSIIFTHPKATMNKWEDVSTSSHHLDTSRIIPE